MLSDDYARDKLRHAGLTLPTDAWVVDAVTGEVGQVVAGLSVHRGAQAGAQASKLTSMLASPNLPSITAETYRVRLSSGEIVERDREQLIRLPPNYTPEISESES